MNKQDQYQNLYNAFTALLKADIPVPVHMNNLCAMLKKKFGFFWVGFYNKKDHNTLQIGPYQGEVPCLNITIGKGVCGLAAQLKKTQIVNDVNSFDGYIACHPEPNSEIVVPGIVNGECHFVLDIDHIEKDYFDNIDQKWLEKLCTLLIEKLN